MYNGKIFQVGAPSAVLAFKGGQLQWVGKTLKTLDEEISTDALKITGGVGNVTQMVYNHSAALSLSITDVQFRQELTAMNLGTTPTVGGNVLSTENVTIQNNQGTITGTPLTIGGAVTAYVYYTYNGVDYSATLNNSTFTTTNIPNGTVLCVSYVAYSSNATTLTVNANLVPDVVSLYVITNLAGTDTATTGFIGRDIHYIPLFKMSGNQTIGLAADGYTETTITGEALAYEDTSIVGCASNQYYATITREIFSDNWYDNASELAISGGDFTLANVGDTKNLEVWFVANGKSLPAPLADLTFTSTTVGTAMVGANTGVVEAVATGTTQITVKITAKQSVTAECTCTVS